MAKSYHLLHRSDPPAISSFDGEKATVKRESRNIVRRRRHRIVQKMHNLSFKILVSKLGQNSSYVNIDDEKPSCVENTCDISMLSNPAIQCVSISETRTDESTTSKEQIKPKGILKKQHIMRSYSLPDGYCLPAGDDLTLEISMTSDSITHPTSNNKNNNVSMSSISKSQSVSTKHVTFSERILRKKYKPSQPVSYLSKSSHRQQCHLKINQPKRSTGVNAESTLTSYDPTMQRKTSATVVLFDFSDDDDDDDCDEQVTFIPHVVDGLLAV